MEEFKKFWTGLKDWYADPVDKNTADNIIEWIDDYVEDPEGTREELDMMNSEFNKEFKDD